MLEKKQGQKKRKNDADDDESHSLSPTSALAQSHREQNPRKYRKRPKINKDEKGHSSKRKHDYNPFVGAGVSTNYSARAENTDYPPSYSFPSSSSSVSSHLIPLSTPPPSETSSFVTTFSSAPPSPTTSWCPSQEQEEDDETERRQCIEYGSHEDVDAGSIQPFSSSLLSSPSSSILSSVVKDELKELQSFMPLVKLTKDTPDHVRARVEGLTQPGKLIGPEISKRAYDNLLTSCPRAYIEKIQLGLLPARIIGKWVPIDKAAIYDRRVPCIGGVNDSRLGPTPRNMKCRQCSESNVQCIGHPGFIRLGKPVPNIEFFKSLCKVLSSVCHHCSRLLLRNNPAKLREVIRTTRGRSRLKKIFELSQGIETCGDPSVPYDVNRYKHVGCGGVAPQYVRTGPGMDIRAYFPDDVTPETIDDIQASPSTSAVDGIRIPTPEPRPHIRRPVFMERTKLYQIMNDISDEDVQAMGYNTEFTHPRDFIFTLFPVPPSLIRPSREHSEG